MPYLLAVSVLWAFSFPLIKGTLVGLDPAWVATVRLLLSLLVFAPFVRPSAVRAPIGWALAAAGAVQFGLMYVLYISAYRYLPAHMIVLMTTTTPLFVALFEDAARRRVSHRAGVAALLAVAGGAVLQYPAQPLSASLAGILLLQCSNIAFALGQVAYRRLSARQAAWNDQQVFALLYAGAVLVGGVSVLARGAPLVPLVTVRQVLVLLFLGVVGSGAGFFLWNRGARLVRGGTLAVMNNAKIPLGVIASLLLLGERTDPLRLFGGAGLMALGLWVASRPDRCASP